MNVRYVFIYTCIVLFSIQNISSAGESKIKGYMFGDYFYNVANNDKSEENFNGFQFRRIYFTFENTLRSNMKVRLRLESSTDKTTGSSLISPYVKDAYLEWAGLLPYHKVVIGLSSSPTWELSEGTWGYRSIEKTIMDLRKIRSSREMGVGLKGALDSNGMFNHHFMVGNGNGYKGPESDKYKLIMYSVWVVPAEGLTVQIYGDYQRKEMDLGKVNDTALKGFVAYEGARFTIGVEGFQQSMKNDDYDMKNMGLSLFGSAVPMPGKQFKVFGRFDHWDPDTEIDDNEVNLLVGGLDFIAARNVHLMPNVVVTTYAADEMDSDITARITFFYRWSSDTF